MRFRTLLGLALCAAATASAQMTNPPAQARLLSLRECVDLALSRNLSLRIEHLTTAIAGDELSSAYGVYVPTFSFEATQHQASELGDFDPHKFNPYFPTDTTTSKIGPELGGKAPFGFSYDLSSFVRRNDALTDFSADPADAASFPGGIRSTNDYSATAGLTMRQHQIGRAH